MGGQWGGDGVHGEVGGSIRAWRVRMGGVRGDASASTWVEDMVSLTLFC